jgi:SAM-dependent methyltransferase
VTAIEAVVEAAIDRADGALKRRVAAHWEAEPCGTRGIEAADRLAFFHGVEAERYAQEPFIREFAGFASARGRRVLEIGVGAGSDYVNWLRAGAHAIGVDLTAAAVRLTRERCTLEGFAPALSRTDCESLPFADASFDVAYSYGVIHHAPDTVKAVAEIRRVLKPGGRVSFVCWGPIDRNEYMRAATGAFNRRQPLPPPPPGAPHPARFGQPGSLSAELRNAGFSGLGEESLTVPLRWPGPPDELWTRQYEISAPLRPYFDSFPPGQKAAAITETITGFAGHYDGREVSFSTAIVVASATK